MIVNHWIQYKPVKIRVGKLLGIFFAALPPETQSLHLQSKPEQVYHQDQWPKLAHVPLGGHNQQYALVAGILYPHS